MTCGTAIVDLPIGSNFVVGFVFRDFNNVPIDLEGMQFILTAKHPGATLTFDTAVDTETLFVEEDATIEPIGQDSYVADRLVLSLTPDISRDIPFGAITRWEIERRVAGDQRNWGAGIFRGYGGNNPDA